MLETSENERLKEEGLKNLVKLLMNELEKCKEEISELKAENKELRDIINRLKGEHVDLERLPKVDKDKSKEASGMKGKNPKAPRNKNNKSGPKKAKIKITKEVTCKLDKTNLPEDLINKGYKELIQQDILFELKNTLYKVECFYSPSEKKLYRAEMPSEYVGHYGNSLKSLLQVLHHFGDVTHSRLKGLFQNMGLQISAGTISSILLENSDLMCQESNDIISSGIEKEAYVHMDGTKSFEKGIGKSTQIICGTNFVVYQTMDSKSKADVIWSLQGKDGHQKRLLFNTNCLSQMYELKIPKKDIKLLGEILEKDKPITKSIIEEQLLNAGAEHLLSKASYPKILACLAIAYYKNQKDFPIIKGLVTDCGPEYKGIAKWQSYCWIHEERNYKKMTPFIKDHQKMVEHKRSQIWKFYDKLLTYKKLNWYEQQASKEGLSTEFDQIFGQKTGFERLDYRLKKTLAKKEKLLQVLEHPTVPLHNNAAELAVRRMVRKRDISYHTISVLGTRTKDAFMSVIETAIKLGVCAFEYLFDRLNRKQSINSLAQMITSCK